MNDSGGSPRAEKDARTMARLALGAPLRLHVHAAVLDRESEPWGAALNAFVNADNASAALRLWFGDEAETLALQRDRGLSLRTLLDRDLAAIDALLAEQLDAILHHAEFKRLEAAWRGIAYLTGEVEHNEKVIVRLLDATWVELERDFDRAGEFDQSTLFARVYSDEYGMPGGIPYGLLLCDYAVSHRRGSRSAAAAPTDDIGVLSNIADVAAAAFSPCVVAAAPELFGVKNFAELSHVQSLDAGFRLSEYQRWSRLQQKEESRFLGVILPRILLREPHADETSRSTGCIYREGTREIGDWLWGNAVYGFGAVVIRAFQESGWFADICGESESRVSAGILARLPAPPFSTGEASACRRPLEVELTDRKQKALEELGFITLSPCSYTESVVFLGAQSLNVPQVGDSAASRNARLASMLQYVLCVSRFAHYAKVIARDRVGAYTTADELERLLGEWLRGYMLGNPDAGAELKARYPLSGGSVEVREAPGKPGVFSCVMHVEPHFRFDQIVTGIQLRTEVQSARVA